MSDKVYPWDLFNPNEDRSNEDLANARFSICTACPELMKIQKRCKQCGCFMRQKVKIQRAVCPLGKW